VRAPSDFEKDVLEAIIGRSGTMLEPLKEQLRLVKVSSRETTGVGFFTNLHLPSEAPRLPGNANLELDDIAADISGLKNGAGFVLFVRDGLMQFLEGYSYDEPWPDSITSYTLRTEIPNS